MIDEHRQNELVTVGQHILEAQKAHPTASGEFSWLLSGITLATKIIQSHVNKAGIANVLGSAQRTNVQGEDVQKLDELANQIICRCLGYRETVGILVSEEDDEPRVLREPGAKAKYVVLFDPLDGSSNIDVNVSIGTIFSILRCLPDAEACNGPLPHILQKGVKQLAAGYVVYGSSTVMAYTTGNGVHMFTLDPSIGAFVLFREHVRMPAAGKMYSVNEAYSPSFPQGVQDYLTWETAADTVCVISAPWWPTSIERFCAAGCSCIPPPSRHRAGSCACSTKPIRWPSWLSRPAAPPPTGERASWTSSPPRCTSALRLSSAAQERLIGYSASGTRDASLLKSSGTCK